MKVHVDRGPRLEPWDLDADTIADVDRHLRVMARMNARNASSVFPGREERARHIALAVTGLLDARLELAETEALHGVDLDGGLPAMAWGSGQEVGAS